MTLLHPRPRTATALAAAALLAPVLALTAAAPGQAASSDACDGGGFRLVNLTTGVTVATSASGKVDRTVTAAALGSGTFGVRGRYLTFDVRLADFAVLDYTFTGAANPADMTGGRRTPVFASKVPDHRGLVLSSGVTVQLDKEALLIGRTGTGLSMKVQAKDCAQGGVFQMEPARGDGTRTRIVHTLADPGGALTPFYYDNPLFRARVGEYVGSACTSTLTGPPSQFCVRVGARTNIGNDVSGRFVARDSAQLAERVPQADCTTAVPVTPSVRHCGGVSVWDVASGGRMGFVTGEDAVEVANSPTSCSEECQAQNQVQGQLTVLGSPFPVPAGSRLEARVSSLPLPAVTAP